MRNALILCTANSARSVLGEALLRHLGQGRFATFSAGSTPRGTVNPDALACLERHGLSPEGFRSKSWEEFEGADAPQMDLIITVCDNAAGEPCPFWPGRPASAHWGIPDPAAATGSDAEIAAEFEVAFKRMKARIEAFMALPADLSDDELKAEMRKIGQFEGATGGVR